MGSKPTSKTGINRFKTEYWNRNQNQKQNQKKIGYRYASGQCYKKNEIETN